MWVEVIEDLEALLALQPAWERLHALDPEAHVFASWPWISSHFRCTRARWQVLAVRRSAEDPEPVAFLPIRRRVQFRSGRGFVMQVSLQGDGLDCYAGLVVRPDCEAQAISALCQHLQRDAWDELRLNNIWPSGRRARLLIQPFQRPRYRSEPLTGFNPESGVDNMVCPQVALPADWEAYLATLSANNRQKMRRLLRRLDGSAELRVEHADAASLDAAIEALTRLWITRWSRVKSEAKGVAAQVGDMVRRCFEAGVVELPVLRHGDRVLAVFALAKDAKHAALRFLVTGRDETYSELPVGYLLHAWCLRDAIARGYRAYDFMHGDEAYKYLFADHDVRLMGASISPRRQARVAVGAEALGSMLARALELEGESVHADTELAYRQIVELAPEHGLALYRFGRFLAQRGRHAEACGLLERSVAAEPQGDNAWRQLARARLALGDQAGALEAARGLLAQRPEDEEGGRLLLELSASSAPAPRLSVQAPIPAPMLKPGLGLSRPLPGSDPLLDPSWVRRELAGSTAAR